NIPIINDKADFKEPVISLGRNSLFKKYDIKDNVVINGGFSLFTSKGNIIIFGNENDDMGVANGVYFFMEEYLNVRWLMPGPLGLDIPENKNISIKPINIIESPTFRWRKLSHLQDYSDSYQKKSVDK